jgi:hypothetical protein
VIGIQHIKESLTEKKLKRLLKADNEFVSIGHFDESGMHYSGFTFPELMKLHHRGVDGHFPARPVLEHLFHSHRKILNHPGVMKAMKRYADSRMTEADLTRMLRTVGQILAYEETEIFGSNLLAKNSAGTIRIKGEDAPLVATEELVNETSYKDSVTKVRINVL